MCNVLWCGLMHIIVCLCVSSFSFYFSFSLSVIWDWNLIRVFEMMRLFSFILMNRWSSSSDDWIMKAKPHRKIETLQFDIELIRCRGIPFNYFVHGKWTDTNTLCLWRRTTFKSIINIICALSRRCSSEFSVLPILWMYDYSYITTTTITTGIFAYLSLFQLIARELFIYLYMVRGTM